MHFDGRRCAWTQSFRKDLCERIGRKWWWAEPKRGTTSVVSSASRDVHPVDAGAVGRNGIRAMERDGTMDLERGYTGRPRP